jgi:hypothetical protein
LPIIVLPSGNRVVAGAPARPGFLTDPPLVGRRQGDVQFFIHYTGIRPEVAQAAPPGTIWVDVSSHNEAYWESLSDIWAKGETFATLEHDIICRPDIVEAFETCPEPWCNFGYSEMCHPQCMEAWANHLGCTRFRPELMEKVPDALSSVTDPALRDWHNACDGLGNNLRAAGFKHHWHFPVAQHDHWAGVPGLDPLA